MAHPTDQQPRRLPVFLPVMMVICCCSLFIRGNVAFKHAFPEGDEGPWLRMAARAFTGQFLESNVVEHDLYPRRSLPHPEDNRSPLFPIIIRMGGVFTHDLFRAAQVMNSILFGLLSLLYGILVKKRFGASAALISMVFVGVSPIFIINSAHIYNDVTMAFGFFIVLLTAEHAPESRLRASIIGCAVGALFLMKTSAIFLLAPLAFSFFHRGGNRERFIRFLFFLAPFCLLALPWMIRNIVHFGTPLYQFTGFVLFTDSMKEVFGVALPRPDLGAYITSHGLLFTFVLRPLLGLKSLLLQLLTHDHHLTPALFPFIALGIWRLRHTHRFWCNVLVFSVPYMGLMAYTAYGFWVDRYVMVYYLVLYLCAGEGIAFCAQRFRRPAFRYGIPLALTALPLLTVAYPLEHYCSPRGSERALDRTAREVIAETGSIVPDSAAVVSSFLGGYAFLHDQRVVNVLEFETPEKFGILADVYTIRFALLDSCDRPTLDLIHAWAGSGHVRCIKRREPFALYEIDRRPP
ncbi:MAG: glycosyltransferase family 39 protein [Chitinispirillaceae bacterium]|nr:glycosyltransferase family 39 protein [Chitinispirillaceae bacterium]